MKQVITNSREETAFVGKSLGKILKKGDVVALSGDLGAGKTVFTGGIAAGLGIEGYITSPTFTLINEYEGDPPLYHFDVYRITDPEEMFEIGFEEYLDGNGVVVVEWADIIEPLLPPEHIRVNIRKGDYRGEDTRIITIEFAGEKYRGLEDAFVLHLDSKDEGKHDEDSGG